MQLYSSKETGTALAVQWLGNGLEYTGHNGYWEVLLPRLSSNTSETWTCITHWRTLSQHHTDNTCMVLHYCRAAQLFGYQCLDTNYSMGRVTPEELATAHSNNTYFNIGMAISSLQLVLWHEPPRYTSRTQLLRVLGVEPKGKDRSGRGDRAHSTEQRTLHYINISQQTALLKYTKCKI